MTLGGTRRAPEIVVRPYGGPPRQVPVAVETPARVDGNAKGGSPDLPTYLEHKAFAKSVASGAPVAADGKVGRDAVHISMAAERSLRSGRILSWQEEADL